MDTLQIAYKILHSLETKKKADYMGTIISPQRLGIEDDEWLDVIRSLLDYDDDGRNNNTQQITQWTYTMMGCPQEGCAVWRDGRCCYYVDGTGCE